MRILELTRWFTAAALACAALGLGGATDHGTALALQAAPAKQAPKTKDEKQRDLRVLFVGNSYCYVNDLPAVIAELAAENPHGPKVKVESVTPGGATLKQHFESTGALEKIREGGWTHVVLQGQSLEPIMHPEMFQEYALKLSAEIEKAGAKVVFYQTWARRAGASEYELDWSGGTPEKMQAGLDAAYAKAAREGHGLAVRVGDAWSAALAEKEPPSLFDEDGSHPTLAGTYLAACVFYESLTGESCIGLATKRKGLAEKDAERLAKIAHALSAK